MRLPSEHVPKINKYCIIKKKQKSFTGNLFIKNSALYDKPRRKGKHSKKVSLEILDDVLSFITLHLHLRSL